MAKNPAPEIGVLQKMLCVYTVIAWGHFERACLKKKAQNSVNKRQNALTADLSDESEEYDLGAVNMCAINSSKPQPQEVIASVKFDSQFIDLSIVTC